MSTTQQAYIGFDPTTITDNAVAVVGAIVTEGVTTWQHVKTTVAVTTGQALCINSDYTAPLLNITTQSGPLDVGIVQQSVAANKWCWVAVAGAIPALSVLNGTGSGVELYPTSTAGSVSGGTFNTKNQLRGLKTLAANSSGVTANVAAFATQRITTTGPLVEAAVDTKFLISFGADITAQRLFDEQTSVQEANFDGRDINLLYPNCGTGPENTKTTVFDWTKTSVTTADLADALAKISATTFTRWTKLFISLDCRAGGNHRWDDAATVTKLAANMAVIAKFCADVEAAKPGISCGIIFDPEPYNATTDVTANPWKYSTLFNPGAVTYENMRNTVRAAATTIANAMFTQHPTLNIITTVGYWEAELNVDTGLPWDQKRYGLLPDFFDGIIDSMAASYPNSYLSDYMQIEYNEYTDAGYQFYTTGSTGILAITRPRATNWRDYMRFDTCIWHSSGSDFKYPATNTNVNTLQLNTSGACRFNSANSAFNTAWFVQTGQETGDGTTRNVIISDQTNKKITIDGSPVNISAGALISARTPFMVWQGTRAALRASIKYAVVYNGNQFNYHYTNSTYNKYPAAYFRAVDKARRGYTL